MSNPHSPFPAGPVPRRASARAANFADCFFEKALLGFIAQHDWLFAGFGGVAVFSEAIGICAIAKHVLIAIAKSDALQRQMIFFFLSIFRLCQIRSCEIIVERQPVQRKGLHNYKL